MAEDSVGQDSVFAEDAPSPAANAVGEVGQRFDAIESLLKAGRTVPLSASAVVDRHAIRVELAKLRAALPTSVQAAQDVLSGNDQQLGGMLADAEERRSRMIARSQIVLAAEDAAAELLADAGKRAAAIRAEADDYLDRQLGLLEVVLEKTQAEIVRGRAILRASSDTGADDQRREMALDDDVVAGTDHVLRAVQA